MTYRDELIAPTAELVTARLDRAIQLIEHGWCQTVSSLIREDDGRKCYCALGALTAACSTHRIYGEGEPDQVVPGTEIFKIAYMALRANIPPQFYSVADYNDATDKDRVVLMFLRAKDTVRKAVAA